MKLLTLALVGLISLSCSRTLKRDYKVVDASKEEVPEWVEDLDEWLDDEEDEKEFKSHRYFTF